MKTKNRHCANGNPDNDAWMKIIGAAPEADDGKDGDGVYDKVEDDVEYKYIFVYMPIK